MDPKDETAQEQKEREQRERMQRGREAAANAAVDGEAIAAAEVAELEDRVAAAKRVAELDELEQKRQADELEADQAEVAKLEAELAERTAAAEVVADAEQLAELEAKADAIATLEAQRIAGEANIDRERLAANKRHADEQKAALEAKRAKLQDELDRLEGRDPEPASIPRRPTPAMRRHRARTRQTGRTIPQGTNVRQRRPARPERTEPHGRQAAKVRPRPDGKED